MPETLGTKQLPGHYDGCRQPSTRLPVRSLTTGIRFRVVSITFSVWVGERKPVTGDWRGMETTVECESMSQYREKIRTSFDLTFQGQYMPSEKVITIRV